MKKDTNKKGLRFSEIFYRVSERNEDVRRDVYLHDFGALVKEMLYEAVNDIGGFAGVCGCAGTVDDDSMCKCVQRKQDRDGSEQYFMSSSVLDLDDACEAIMKVAGEVVSSLKEKSFLCECDLTESKKQMAESREEYRKYREQNALGEYSLAEVDQVLPDVAVVIYDDTAPSTEKDGEFRVGSEPF